MTTEELAVLRDLSGGPQIGLAWTPAHSVALYDLTGRGLVSASTPARLTEAGHRALAQLGQVAQ